MDGHHGGDTEVVPVQSAVACDVPPSKGRGVRCPIPILLWCS